MYIRILLLDIKKKSSLISLGSLRTYKNLQMKKKYISKFSSITGIFQRVILLLVLCSSSLLIAQTAPNINYPTPPTYKLGIPITNLTAKNTGGVIPNALQGVTNFVPANGTEMTYATYGVFDSSGNFFVTNPIKHVILKITPAGLVSIFAGTSAVPGNVNGTGTAARFDSPSGIAIDGNNTLFVCDRNNQSIRQISAGGIVSTLAGGRGRQANLEGIGTVAGFSFPTTIVIDTSGNLFVAEGYRIRKVTPGGDVTNIAGSTSGSTDGTGTDATFNVIGGMTIDANNTIYITERGNHKIRKMITPSYAVTTIAGTGKADFVNGIGLAASFNTPTAIIIDAASNLFVQDYNNFVMRKITPAGVVSTYAFTGIGGYTNANLDNSTIFDDVYSMAFDATKNNIYIVGQYSGIRKLSRFGYSVSPALPAGLSIDGTGTISGIPTAVTAMTNYTITATNAAGISSKVVAITVALATPTITAKPVILLSSTSVLMNGAITNLGVTSPTQHGFVWSTTVNPTIDLVTKTSLGAQAAIGSFSSTITGLTPNTAYHVRGYATNSVGTDYSNDVVFSTNFYPVITPLFNGLNFIFNFAQQSLVSAGNLTIRLFGSIFKPKAAYKIQLFSDPITLATGTIDTNGTLDQIITLPADTPIGLHHIVLTTLLADNTPYQREIYIIVNADGSVSTDYNVMMMDISENTTAVANILGTDSDTPAQTLTYSISGGADAAKFSINSTTGTLAFIAAPDFETPTNANADNVYVVNVSVTDSGALNKSITNTLYLNVTNVAEIPLITTPQSSPAAIGAGVSAVIVNDGGGGSITTKGFVYSLTSANSNPMIGGTGVTSVVGQMSATTAMGTTLTGLATASAYTFKAFAVNATGTAYSAATSFTTLGMNSVPSISYASPQNYEINKAITALTPVSIGSTIPVLTYAQVSTFAGSGTAGAANGNGSAATFSKPMGVTLDNSGNLIVADATSNKIRKIASNGDVTTVAGSGTAGYNLSSTSITNPLLANFKGPSAVAVDVTGNVFVTDQGSSQIRKIGTNGTVTVFAGKDWIYSFPFGYNPQPGFADGTSTAAAFNKPEGLTIDSNGNLYVADTYNHRIRKITSAGIVTTIAGDGNTDLFGGGRFVDGNGTSASFNYPTGVALDPTESYLYVADKVNERIRKILLVAPYTVTTLAGNGTKSSLDGITTAATLNDPEHLVVDGAGNLFVTEQNGNKIRKITPDGIVSTIAGSGTAGTTDGIGTAASFSGLTGLALSKTGVAYVTDSNANKVRKIALGGYTVAPALPIGLSIDGTTGTISGTPTIISGPINYSVSGSNYYGTSTAIVAITTANLPTVTTATIATIASTSASGGGNVTSNGGAELTAEGICWSTSQNPTTADSKTTESIASGAFTSVITGLTATTTYYVRAYATNSIGTAYGSQVSFTTIINAPSISYSNLQNYSINKLITPLVSSNTGGEMPNALYGQVSTFAGTGQIGSVDGVGATASFNNPYGITIDASGNLFIGDRQNYKIRKITAAGVVSTIAGSGSYGSFNATGTAATFNSPQGVALDASGNIYVADYASNLIRKITTGGVVSTLAGSGSNGLVDGTGIAANISRPSGVAVDASGNVFVTDSNNYAIRKITAAGVVTTFAGNGEPGILNGTGTSATFNNITGITIDAVGNLYVIDNNKIRKITPSGDVTTFAGIGDSGSANGAINSASFYSPKGLTVDAQGDVYVVDTYNNLIRKIATTGMVTTIAGSGSQGATDGINTEASFYLPSGIAVDASGNVFVTDSKNNKIRKISNLGYSISPALPLGLTLDATGTISGTPTVISPATDYTVTAYNAGGNSSYTLNFAVTSALGVAQETFSKAVVAYPNPYSDYFKIDAKTNSSDVISISIYDMLAKEIENRKVTPAEMGALQYGKDYPSGVYNVIVKQGIEVKILRVIKK